MSLVLFVLKVVCFSFVVKFLVIVFEFFLCGYYGVSCVFYWVALSFMYLAFLHLSVPSASCIKFFFERSCTVTSDDVRSSKCIYDVF